jgi:uncharacterized protein YndB with AHSA1/START domain
VSPEPYRASIVVEAEPDTVFDYFTVPERIVRWMGDYAVLDPTPGGEFTLDINGVPVRGSYIEVDRPRRLVIGWGHAGSDRLPPGSSTLEVTFTPADTGTVVSVVHSDLPEPEAEQHATGWAHFLARLAIAAPGDDPGPDPFARMARGAR